MCREHVASVSQHVAEVSRRVAVILRVCRGMSQRCSDVLTNICTTVDQPIFAQAL